MQNQQLAPGSPEAAAAAGGQQRAASHLRSFPPPCTRCIHPRRLQGPEAQHLLPWALQACW
jgi:hypothetical protein